MNGLIAAMQKHAAELEARGERHVYGPAINKLLVLEQKMDALREAACRADMEPGDEDGAYIVSRIYSVLKELDQ